MYETILYDNNICLECHANYSNFQLLSNQDEINVVESHDWLPNQVAHFQAVRCIEYTSVNDDTIHLLPVPKEQAVRKCTECHSSDSGYHKFRARKVPGLVTD
ncbi:MAG: hypothetical protein R2727_03430 [Bacteroidales bacterium]